MQISKLAPWLDFMVKLKPCINHISHINFGIFVQKFCYLYPNFLMCTSMEKNPPFFFFHFHSSIFSLRMKGWEGIQRLTGTRWSGWCERSFSAGSRMTPSLRSAISRLLLLVQELSPAHAAPAPPPHCPLRAQTPEAMQVDTCKTSSTAPMALLSIPTPYVYFPLFYAIYSQCTIYIMVH